MRSHDIKDSATYYHFRLVHKWSGYCLNVVTKFRILVISIIDRENLTLGLSYAFWGYVGFVVIGRITFEIISRKAGKNFRH